MTGRLECTRRHGAPEYTHVIPNGFWLGGHSGRPERWSHDGTRWVAAEPSRYGFSVWGYDNDAPVVVRLGENLSGREVERVAELFLAEKTEERNASSNWDVGQTKQVKPSTLRASRKRGTRNVEFRS